MAITDIPKTFNFGAGEVVELSFLEQMFGISRRTACKYLRALHIKPMYIGKKVFFSLPTFKRIMFVLSLPGAPGFIFPGSTAKNNVRLTKEAGYITEVTDEILLRAEAPQVLAEMNAAEGHDASVLKKFIKPQKNKPAEDK